MANMQKNKTAMPEQDPQARGRSFQEVTLGYTDEMAKQEAERCLNCKNKPCVGGCPVGVKIPEFITCVKEGDLEKAYEILSGCNSLPAVCGRVCPRKPSASRCAYAASRAIRWALADSSATWPTGPWPPARSRAGPPSTTDTGWRWSVPAAGLSCAGALRAMGYDVTIFQALHTPGGVLMYGIPEFRLPKALVQREIDTLREAGVKILTNVIVGRSILLDELVEDEGFEAVFVGSGAGLPRFQGIEGEALCGVYSANEFLTASA